MHDVTPIKITFSLSPAEFTQLKRVFQTKSANKHEALRRILSDIDADAQTSLDDHDLALYLDGKMTPASYQQACLKAAREKRVHRVHTPAMFSGSPQAIA